MSCKHAAQASEECGPMFGGYSAREDRRAGWGSVDTTPPAQHSHILSFLLLGRCTHALPGYLGRGLGFSFLLWGVGSWCEDVLFAERGKWLYDGTMHRFLGILQRARGIVGYWWLRESSWSDNVYDEGLGVSFRTSLLCASALRSDLLREKAMGRMRRKGKKDLASGIKGCDGR